jgi:copper chaperone
VSTLTYSVPDVSCSHCQSAISSEVGAVAGVDTVVVDLETKTVTVSGEGFDEQAVLAAIGEAGYEVAV